MFFEGSEKRVEVRVSTSTNSLRLLDDKFWVDVVASANAEILSKMSNEFCDAYLLSESCLFVWDDKLLMLTCGNTRLIDAVILCVDKLGLLAIASVTYQRKSEYLSHLQASCFSEDLLRLRSKLSGAAYRIGHLDTHHHYLFATETVCPALVPKSNNELLMYHIKGAVADYLRSDRQSCEQIRQMLGLEALFPSFTFDDHLFSPFGYSINGLWEDKYMTIHITPQEQSSYVSIETNLHSELIVFNIFSALLNKLNPQSWDVISFNSEVVTDGFPPYFSVASCILPINDNDTVQFNQYQQLKSEVLLPELL
ncbi:S-adenosylmethionine decarboxylase proenzyme [Shewanella sp. D64]|uniref:adenosylmethionine decarboxylase n=1 Tax=unclassified Shewanella TaxID=196818 RepID=UPI0022BA43F8|nr:MULTISPECIES: adenosylmethionine decarboxylase [unclassified Shewanella]MEC4724892.1 S-adenosylmethionine decarboxylase proenzyme [Shewanella sp. D64]MEC4736315.1 S-adenosylmethionine decarboxylase proenzyme [Shewanella sp. E94]WBJ97623.1 S-adenosylmethionine decarboxylase proenzyme [Shewanella sp. MTB7]